MTTGHAGLLEGSRQASPAAAVHNLDSHRAKDLFILVLASGRGGERSCEG